MFRDNEWYSHRKTLANYCGVEDHPVCGTIQHGWFILKKTDIKRIKNSKLPFTHLFCWNNEIKNFFSNGNIKNVISIGAPFIYFADNYNQRINAKGNTLVFHPHSDFENNNKSNGFVKIQEFINKVKALYNGPYTVCLYYQDMTPEIIKIYKTNNFKIFSCGDRLDNNYFKNLFEIIKSHKEVVVCELTSAALYSIYLNKTTTFFRVEKTSRNYFGEPISFHEYDYHNNENIISLVSNKTEQYKKKIVADNILGLEFKKKPQELKKILGWDNSFKKIYSNSVKNIKMFLNLY